jgi:hypothetical protein
MLWRGCGSSSTDGEAPVVFRGGEVKDGVLHDEGNPRVTSAPSIASRRRSRGRLETSGGSELRIARRELDLLHVEVIWEHEEGRQRK